MRHSEREFDAIFVGLGLGGGTRINIPGEDLPEVVEALDFIEQIHSTPLHQAVCAGHLDVVRFLVERGARLDIKDTTWEGTPLGWALHCEKPEIAAYLRSQGATTARQ